MSCCAKASGAFRGGEVQAPAALEWRSVTLQLGVFSIRRASLRLEPGGWVAVVGPTGAGKSLLLEVATGFHTPTFGHVLRNGVDITRVPPEARRVAYVPQDILLFPHLDVRGNLLFGARSGASDARAPDHELSAVATGLDLTHLLDRRVATLSGGEAQRVAIGRALLAGPGVVLLDESTSALDEATRRTVGDFLEQRRARRNLSIVQVTHDVAEAHRLADVVIGVEAGEITGPVAPGDEVVEAASLAASRKSRKRKWRSCNDGSI